MQTREEMHGKHKKKEARKERDRGNDSRETCTKNQKRKKRNTRKNREGQPEKERRTATTKQNTAARDSSAIQRAICRVRVPSYTQTTGEIASFKTKTTAIHHASFALSTPH